MSYCRFSSDLFQCDVYCYEDVSGGVTLHVASGRHFISEKKLKKLKSITNFIDRHMALMEVIEQAEIKAIDKPLAGDSYFNISYEEALKIMKKLRGYGYNVPQYAIDTIKEDLEDEE